MLKLIVFDFDGTLIDTMPLAFEQFQLVFKNFNLDPLAFKDLKPHFGLKIVDIMVKLLPKHTASQIEEMMVYWKLLSPQFSSKAKILPEVLETLKKLHRKYNLAIFTSRTQLSLKVILKNHRVDTLFKQLVTLEHVQNHKPHPEGLLKILKELNCRPQEAVYVGDTQFDIQAAKAARVKAILIHPDKNHGLEPDHHLQEFSDLEKLLTTL